MRSEIGVHPWAKYFQPYLNGEPLKHCRMADEELGCAEVYHTRVTDHGEIRLDPRKYGTRMVFGEVEDRPTTDLAARIKAEPERAQEIWDAYYEEQFGAMEREIAAGPWEARQRR